jgi:hypothetical protein
MAAGQFKEPVIGPAEHAPPTHSDAPPNGAMVHGMHSAIADLRCEGWCGRPWQMAAAEGRRIHSVTCAFPVCAYLLPRTDQAVIFPQVNVSAA